ncbi:MAG: protein-L-isoaspartate O-methyltransferase [Pseudomonadota bacterium]
MAKEFEHARRNMVESQVRPNGIVDRRIPRAMAELPREKFLPASLRAVAYADQDIWIDIAATDAGADLTPASDELRETRRALLRPMVQAQLIQLCDLGPDDLALDVACGTGYSTAVLGALAGGVVGLDVAGGLVRRAEQTLSDLGTQAVFQVGALADGYPGAGPYDAILINGAVAEPPLALIDQLKPDGRLVCVVRRDGSGQATVFERVGETRWSSGVAFSCTAPMLPAFSASPVFSF